MDCPVCPATTLHTHRLAPTLAAQACASCHGQWIASTDYWSWLARQPAGGGEEPLVAEDAPPASAARAACCPHCGYLLLCSPIAADLPDALAQCGHCNSFWLPAGLWETLCRRGLHTQLHRITSPTWQRALRQAASQQTWDAIYTAKLGAVDYAEAQRVRAWLQQHPARQLLLAYLSHDDSAAQP